MTVARSTSHVAWSTSHGAGNMPQSGRLKGYEDVVANFVEAAIQGRI
jgi:hypothetical protein